MKHTIDELHILQALPLDIKVQKTKQRIKEWINEFGEDGVYISFSGGKDSTVLLHLVRELYPNVTAVFCDTGLEYPEIKSFVKTFENVEILRPKRNFSETIKKFGYPIISKEVAHHLHAFKKNPDGYTHNMFSRDNPKLKQYGSRYDMTKWCKIASLDFTINDYCCNQLKKNPSHLYSSKTGKQAITGQMAEESAMRTQKWLMYGCNSFEKKHMTSNPMSFWTEQDVLKYIYENHIEICSVYGEVEIVAGTEDLLGNVKYKTTGCSRTGCIFCGFGAHLEKGETRYQKLKRTHQRLYEYCIGGGEYGEDGLWQPNKDGLGFGHVFDCLNNIYGENFIRYK